MSRNSSVMNPTQNQQEKIEDLNKLILHVDSNCGTYYPTTPEDQNIKVVCSAGITDPEKLPVPPDKFWHWYNFGDKQKYLAGGKHQKDLFFQVARNNGFRVKKGKRILDFGCSGARVTRWFLEEAQQGLEIWGCDIDAAAIEWCQKNLMPPFHFFTNNTLPHLPIKEGYFDFIFAGSVFTHIKDMSSSWLMELHRCLARDGIAIFTVTTDLSLEKLHSIAEKDKEGRQKVPKYIVDNKIDEPYLKERGFITIQSSPWWLATIYHSDYFIKRASSCFDIIDIVPNLKGYQTGFVLKPKKERGYFPKLRNLQRYFT